MGMGNWTWPGASTIQLLSLGRWSSSKSGLKSAGDTWHYQLLSVNWEIRKPEALGTHRPACSSLSYVSSWECEGGFDTLWSLCWCVRPWVQNICLYVKYEAVLAPAAGGLWEQQGFGVNHELSQGPGVGDYRARCPSVLNKRMSRIKRQCSPVCCKLGFTPHIRDREEDQEPKAHDGEKYWFLNLSRVPWSLLRGWWWS